MKKNFGIGVLIACFSLSSVNAGLATQVVEVPPIIVQPYDLNEINQQTLTQDRINRDQELAIKGLIDDNQKLTNTALAHRDDAVLEKVNQTMGRYRDYLMSRDKVQVLINGQWVGVGRYDDLVKLTEDVDAVRSVGQTLELKRDVIEDKYKILNDLKDEMVELNEKLTNGKQQGPMIPAQQGDKIQMLTQRLAEMDQKIAHYDEILAEKDKQIVQLKGQVDLLKSELEDKITQAEQTPSAAGNPSVNRSESLLKEQARELKSKEDTIHELNMALADAKENHPGQQAQVVHLPPIVQMGPIMVGQAAPVTSSPSEAQGNPLLQQQALDLKAKDESIRWLNKVLAVSKEKAEYYRLTSEQDRSSVLQVKDQVNKIKEDFAMRFKDYNDFQNAILSLKSQIGQLGQRLAQKQDQAEQLKTQLENRTIQSNSQEDQILKMRSDLRDILQDRAKKEIYLHNETLQRDDRVKLAKQLIELQDQEASLLNEKSDLEATQSANFEKHFNELEGKIKSFLSGRQMEKAELQSRADELKGQLDQKEQQVASLKTELENKIAQEKSQVALEDQIQDLKSQVQEKTGQITAMTTDIQSGKEAQSQVEAMKKELAIEQDQLVSLKQELEARNAQSDKMTGIMEDYQKRLEARSDTDNEKIKQIAVLNARLQQKEADLVKIKKMLYDVQELNSAKDRDAQTKDLNISIIQQKVLDQRISEYQEQINGLRVTGKKQAQEVKYLKAALAAARQQLVGMPSSDELEFLRAGLKKASGQLRSKDQMIFQLKANADEYTKEFKNQTKSFQNLTEQLLDAQQQIDRKNEDLKYKDLEMTRFKELSLKRENDLKAQLKTLRGKVEHSQKGLLGRIHENKVDVLQAELQNANDQIKELQGKLNELEVSSKGDAVQDKLKQALDKIDEQGRLIATLVGKLQDAGQSVDLTKM